MVAQIHAFTRTLRDTDRGASREKIKMNSKGQKSDQRDIYKTEWAFWVLMRWWESGGRWLLVSAPGKMVVSLERQGPQQQKLVWGKEVTINSSLGWFWGAVKIFRSQHPGCSCKTGKYLGLRLCFGESFAKRWSQKPLKWVKIHMDSHKQQGRTQDIKSHEESTFCVMPTRRKENAFSSLVRIVSLFLADY